MRKIIRLTSIMVVKGSNSERNWCCMKPSCIYICRVFFKYRSYNFSGNLQQQANNFDCPPSQVSQICLSIHYIHLNINLFTLLFSSHINLSVNIFVRPKKIYSFVVALWFEIWSVRKFIFWNSTANTFVVFVLSVHVSVCLLQKMIHWSPP